MTKITIEMETTMTVDEVKELFRKQGCPLDRAKVEVIPTGMAQCSVSEPDVVERAAKIQLHGTVVGMIITGIAFGVWLALKVLETL